MGSLNERGYVVLLYHTMSYLDVKVKGGKLQNNIPSKSLHTAADVKRNSLVA